MGQLGRRRHPEAGHPQPGRVDAGEHAADHAVLAAGVHRLEHDEQGPLALGEQPLLQLGDGGELERQLGLGLLLGPTRTSRRVGGGRGRRGARRAWPRGPRRALLGLLATAGDGSRVWQRRLPLSCAASLVSAAPRDGRHDVNDVACGARRIATHTRGNWCVTRNHPHGGAGERSRPRPIGFALIAAACSDKKDDESVGGADATHGRRHGAGARRRTDDTASEGDGHGDDGRRGHDARTGRRRRRSEAAIPTLPAPTMDPVMGGALVVAGEAEVANPWTPAAMQCDSYCQQRARTFYRPAVRDRRRPRGAPVPRREHRAQRGLHASGRSSSARASRSTTARRSTPTPRSTTSTAPAPACSSPARSPTWPR